MGGFCWTTVAQLEDDLVQAADADPTPPIHTYVSRRAGGQGGSRFVWQLRVVRCPFQHRQPGEGGVLVVLVCARVRGAARADFTGRVYAQSAESLEKERITIRWVLTALLSVTDESPRMMNSCTLSPPSSPSPLPRSLSPSLHTSLSEIHSWASTSLQAASLYCLH